MCVCAWVGAHFRLITSRKAGSIKEVRSKKNKLFLVCNKEHFEQLFQSFFLFFISLTNSSASLTQANTPEVLLWERDLKSCWHPLGTEYDLNKCTVYKTLLGEVKGIAAGPVVVIRRWWNGILRIWFHIETDMTRQENCYVTRWTSLSAYLVSETPWKWGCRMDTV